MIISDLNHVEVVSEKTETSIEGGYYRWYSPSSYASSSGSAVAYGWYTSTGAYTSTFTYPGYSSSYSSTGSSSSGF
jgi:hypothetical protein